METSAAGFGFQPDASLPKFLLRRLCVGCWARSTSAGSEVTNVGHGFVSLAKMISFQKFQMEGLGSGWPFLRQALGPPAWSGRAGPLPRGQGCWPALPGGCHIRLALSSPRLSGSNHQCPWRPVPEDRRQRGWFPLGTEIQPCGNCRQACAGRGSPCRPPRDPSEGRRLAASESARSLPGRSRERGLPPGAQGWGLCPSARDGLGSGPFL